VVVLNAKLNVEIEGEKRTTCFKTSFESRFGNLYYKVHLESNQQAYNVTLMCTTWVDFNVLQNIQNIVKVFQDILHNGDPKLRQDKMSIASCYR